MNLREFWVTGCGLCVFIAAGCTSMERRTGMESEQEIVLGAYEIHHGLESRKTLLDDDRNLVKLDGRVFEFGDERQGVIQTDVIDLGRTDGVLGRDSRVQEIALDIEAETPPGSSVTWDIRTGNHFFSFEDWSGWETIDGTRGRLADPAGRYIQARIVLQSESPEALPSVSALRFRPVSEPAQPQAESAVEVAEARIEKIVRSPIEFHYERPDQSTLAWFRKTNNLDAVVADADSDFDALVKLMDWTGACKNIRGENPHREKGFYAWNLDDGVFEMRDGKPHIHGHCMSYASVLISAAQSLGHVAARHWVIEGFRQATHEIAEIWVPSLGKWVYLDPSLTNYYYDEETGEPLGLLEIHRIVADNFVPEDKDMHWWSDRRSPETRARVREVGGKNPIGSRLGPSHYGAPMDPDYNWGWLHGYLAVGFAQMTPRNDFHSHPDKTPRRFGQAPGYEGHPFWVDEKTPPTAGGHNWFTRQRDFNWTVEQASVRLILGDKNTVRVELGNSMPHFQTYRLVVNGDELEQTGSVYEWTLEAGPNKLEVKPVDAFGKVGQGSAVVLHRRS